MRLSAFIPHKLIREGLQSHADQVLAQAGIGKQDYHWDTFSGKAAIVTDVDNLAKKISKILNRGGEFNTSTQETATGGVVYFSRLKEFAPNPKGDSGTGLTMPPEKHELQDQEAPKKKCSWCGKSFLVRPGIDSGQCPYCASKNESLSLTRLVEAYGRFDGINGILSRNAQANETLIASNESYWSWEYDANYLDAGIYVSNTGMLRLLVIETHIKSGLGAGTEVRIKEDTSLGSVSKPNLSIVKTILAKHGHIRTRAGSGFKQQWTASDGTKSGLSAILSKLPKG